MNFLSCTLGKKAEEDKIILAFASARLDETTITDITQDFMAHCTVRCYFKGINVSEKNQYLVVYSLVGMINNPTAQIFVYEDFVRSEQISGEQQVALLMDVPGDSKREYFPTLIEKKLGKQMRKGEW